MALSGSEAEVVTIMKIIVILANKLRVILMVYSKRTNLLLGALTIAPLILKSLLTVIILRSLMLRMMTTIMKQNRRTIFENGARTNTLSLLISALKIYESARADVIKLRIHSANRMCLIVCARFTKASYLSSVFTRFSKPEFYLSS